ncbi:MAG: hypothetical protein RLZZ490_904 [Cyanobacteriota bacterium]|jgi:hypothetical protein
MPNIINQDSAGNTYYGYIDSVAGNQFASVGLTELNDFFTTAYGSPGTIWAGSGDNGASKLAYGFRFNHPDETKTGTISGNFDWNTGLNTIRCALNFWSGGYGFCSNNSTGINWNALGSFSYASAPSPRFPYLIAGQNSLIFVNIGPETRSTLGFILYLGWLKEGAYTGNQYSRNFSYMISPTVAQHPSAVNTTSRYSYNTANDSITNPSIVCEVGTPGADTTDVIFRDNFSPYNAIGKPYNLLSLPSSCVAGKLYKNNGVDPDGSDNNKWLCVGNWGGRKLGVRVWLEGYN